MRNLRTMTAAELAAAYRPMRTGAELDPRDHERAQAITPQGAPLARVVFATTRAGRLDRRRPTPMAILEG